MKINPPFFFLFLIFSNFLAVQTAFIAPIQKDHISKLYHISLHLKTPLRPAKLHLDLGGPFSWIDCSPAHLNSSTAREIDCDAPLCKSLNALVCSNCQEGAHPECSNCNVYPEQPSLRDSLDYANPPKKLTDSENVTTDVLALHTSDGSNPGPLRPIPNFPFACTKPAFLRGLASGVIGLAALGRANESIPSMVSSRFNVPRYFAVCLSGSRSDPGVAFFGSKGPYKFLPNVDLSESLTYIPLIQNPVAGSIYTYWLPSYEYYIGLTAIRVNGKSVPMNTTLLEIEPEHGAGGTKVSTSTPYALLRTSIHRAFTEMFVRESAAFGLKVVSPVKPFSACFAANSVKETAVGAAVPEVELVIGKNGVVWRMKGRNSMVRIKKNGVDVWCLGYVDGGVNPRTTVVIGGLQMEDQLLQFDLENYRMGFSSSALLRGTACSNFNFKSNKNLM